MEITKDCLFCSKSFKEDRRIDEYGSVYAVYDGYPVTDKHVLIIPYRHSIDYFWMTPEEKADMNVLLDSLSKKILDEDREVSGFNIGVNCGFNAGQTIAHAHIHLIPRRWNDVSDPIGGVRNVIPGKGNYKKW